MSIQCLICERVFEKQITNSHLKSHQLTTTDYKLRFGENSLSSADYKTTLSKSRSGENNSNYGKRWTEEKKTVLSEKLQGKTPWNFGKKIEVTDNMKAGIAKREEKYRSGELIRSKSTWNDAQRAAQSEKMKAWAIQNPELASEKARKAISTKIKNGLNVAFFRGKKHSEHTKRLLSARSISVNARKSKLAFEKRLEKIEEANLILLSEDNNLLSLRCKKCNHEFTLTRQCFTESKFSPEWCNTCFPLTPSYRSKSEIELYEYVLSLTSDAISNHRQLIGRQEVDIYIPRLNLAIEFNGLYWHSEDGLAKTGKSKTSDYEKMQALRKKGIRYIGIFEDEWINNQEIVKSRLANILGKSTRTVYARKCSVKEISSKESGKFCRENHIQGAGRSNVRYGMFYNNELVSVMTFSKTNLSRRIKDWEINRFCHKLGIRVVGGASKIFKRFITDHNPKSIISYADSRWSEGDLYGVLGFDFVKQTVPNYWYVYPGTTKRIHRFALRKTNTDDKLKTEKTLRKEQNYLVIYDCGSTKWKWEAIKPPTN